MDAPNGLGSSAVIAFLLVDVLLIVALARLLGSLARRVGQPTVVGEILAGVLLGPTLLGATLLQWDNAWGFLNCPEALAGSPGVAPSVTSCLFPPQVTGLLGGIGQLGLLFFTFLVGLALQSGSLRGRVHQVVGVTTGVLVTPIGGGFLLAPMFFDATFVGNFGTSEQPSQVAFALAMGALLSVTALPIMAHILHEKRMGQAEMATVALTSAAIVTVAMFLLVSVAGAIASGGMGPVVARTSLVGLYLAVMAFGVRPLLRRWLRRPGGVIVDRSVFAGVMVLLMLSGLIAHMLGVSVMVGGFVAGLVLPARTTFRRELAPRLEDVTLAVLLPVFLAFSGLQTDFTALDLATAGWIGLFVATSIVVKWAGGAGAARLVGLSWREANELGVLMNCRGLLPLVVALLAIEEGLIAPPMHLAAIVMALVTTAMTGPLHDRFTARPGTDAPSGPESATAST